MILKRHNVLYRIIAGLSLPLFVMGGLGVIHAASSSTLKKSPVSTMANDRLLQEMMPASQMLAITLTQTPSPETRTYAVEPGDTLWSIAVKFYGNGSKYPLIQRANELPGNPILRTGQVLVIPFSESDGTQTPRAPALVSVTPSAVPSLFSPSPIPLPSFVPASQASATATPMNSPSPVAPSSTSGLALAMPILGIVVNVLIAICLIGSAVCALLSYDIYRRARHYARRRHIGSRVRAGL